MSPFFAPLGRLQLHALTSDAVRQRLRHVFAIVVAWGCATMGCGGSGLRSQPDATNPGDHIAVAFDAGVDAAGVAVRDGSVDLSTDAGSDRSADSAGLSDARDVMPDLPPMCPNQLTSGCPLPGLVCYLPTGGSQTSKCTCYAPVPGNSDSGGWACMPLGPPPPGPPPLPLDAGPDANLAGPDGGFTNSCVDCLRADRCQGNDPTSGLSITSECQGLAGSGLAFGELLGQVLADCQATIYQLHCP
jgi:hypothetical protein